LEALLLNRLLPGNSVNRRYRCLDLDYEVPQPVEQPAGAFLMIRRSVWEELGGFDEMFHPLWFEDVDFCKRAMERKYPPYYTPAAAAEHVGGHSIYRIPVEMKPYYWYRSFVRYAVKHFRPPAARMVAAAIVVGSILRMLADVVVRRSLKPLGIYGRIVGMAGRTMLFGS
jgi:N-acetylglucosaminyl-diphospho-decaprenol L-rhamnosyltransferase